MIYTLNPSLGSRGRSLEIRSGRAGKKTKEIRLEIKTKREIENFFHGAGGDLENQQENDMLLNKSC